VPCLQLSFSPGSLHGLCLGEIGGTRWASAPNRQSELPGLVNIQKTMERSTIFNGKTMENSLFRLGHLEMPFQFYWLVVYLPLWKMMEWKSVGMMTFPIWWESHSKFHGSSDHQPVFNAFSLEHNTCFLSKTGVVQNWDSPLKILRLIIIPMDTRLMFRVSHPLLSFEQTREKGTKDLVTVQLSDCYPIVIPIRFLSFIHIRWDSLGLTQFWWFIVGSNSPLYPHCMSIVSLF